MPYALGIDLGSGRITAAISRNDHERWLAPEVVPLDGDPAGVVSVLHLTDEGAVDVGSAATGVLPDRADRVARDVPDRIGDEIPVTLGGQPYPAEVLTAAVVGWVVDYVEASEGAPASQLVVTHPSSWGLHRRALLLGALREVNLPEPTLLPRPVAVAESHAAAQRVEIGEHVAVLSLGTSRCESAVLRRGSFGFELRAHTGLGDATAGDRFDDLLTDHVLAGLRTAPRGGAMASLRAACTSAKERLSTETTVSVSGVRVTRAEFEELIRPTVEHAVESLSRTIRSAGPDPVPTVVLAGGSARIPLVTELVAAGTRARVVVDDPETSTASGAALAAARVAKPTVRATAVTMAPEPIPRSAITHTDLMRLDDLPEEDLSDLGPPPPRPPVEIAPLDPPKRRLLGLRASTRPAADPKPRRRPPERSDDRSPDSGYFDDLAADRPEPIRLRKRSADPDHLAPDPRDPDPRHTGLDRTPRERDHRAEYPDPAPDLRPPPRAEPDDLAAGPRRTRDSTAPDPESPDTRRPLRRRRPWSRPAPQPDLPDDRDPVEPQEDEPHHPYAPKLRPSSDTYPPDLPHPTDEPPINTETPDLADTAVHPPTADRQPPSRRRHPTAQHPAPPPEADPRIPHRRPAPDDQQTNLPPRHHRRPTAPKPTHHPIDPDEPLVNHHPPDLDDHPHSPEPRTNHYLAHLTETNEPHPNPPTTPDPRHTHRPPDATPPNADDLHSADTARPHQPRRSPDTNRPTHAHHTPHPADADHPLHTRHTTDRPHRTHRPANTEDAHHTPHPTDTDHHHPANTDHPLHTRHTTDRPHRTHRPANTEDAHHIPHPTNTDRPAEPDPAHHIPHPADRPRRARRSAEPEGAHHAPAAADDPHGLRFAVDAESARRGRRSGEVDEPRHAAAPEPRRHRYLDPEDSFEPADRDGGHRR